MLFGAGKIGRSFIAQLFSRSGYETVFIDIDKDIIREINKRGKYAVIIRDRPSTSHRKHEEESLPVANIRALHLSEVDKIVDEIVTADILAVSVGQKGLMAAIPLIARAVHARFVLFPHSPLDIIIAENMRDASEWITKQFKEELPSGFPLESFIGLIETSIGKMVPLITAANGQDNPLDVFAEAYNTLILDKTAFRNSIPDVKGLAPKENMKAWVDRKLFIHNLGHAALAYFSFIEDPSVTYTWEALEMKQVIKKVSETMHESARVLQNLYPDEFTAEDLEEHISDLLRRFANRSLGDTIFRVGCDLERKLGPDDRLVPVVKLAHDRGLPYGNILEALVSGIYFDARDQNGYRYPADDAFLHKFNRNITGFLQFHCNFDPLYFSVVYTRAKRINSNIKAKLNSDDQKN